jgi:hypothetical protein
MRKIHSYRFHLLILLLVGSLYCGWTSSLLENQDTHVVQLLFTNYQEAENVGAAVEVNSTVGGRPFTCFLPGADMTKGVDAHGLELKKSIVDVSQKIGDSKMAGNKSVHHLAVPRKGDTAAVVAYLIKSKVGFLSGACDYVRLPADPYWTYEVCYG